MSVETMRMCEKRERDRERKWRMTDQGAFESSMLSLDHVISTKHCKDVPTPAGDDADFAGDSWQSDHGAGVEAIIRHCDRAAEKARHRRMLDKARKQLERAKHGDWHIGLSQAYRHSFERNYSICELTLGLLMKRHSGRSRKPQNGKPQECSTGGR